MQAIGPPSLRWGWGSLWVQLGNFRQVFWPIFGNFSTSVAVRGATGPTPSPSFGPLEIGEGLGVRFGTALLVLAPFRKCSAKTVPTGTPTITAQLIPLVYHSKYRRFVLQCQDPHSAFAEQPRPAGHDLQQYATEILLQ